MASSSSSSMMDTSGFSQVGRYGTICLMKRQEPDTVVTGFGIDTEQLTFGRDPACGVRLYYPDVGLVHCKIVFEERKGFLVVLGANGLLIDGCKVYPNNSPSPFATPTTIPLTNGSEFEIHGKRFKFMYPPKEIRAALMATPARPTHRAMRLSMIHSAQVFSPRPSKDPRENLRILRSPLKNTFKTPAKSGISTPARASLFPTSSQSPYKTPTKYNAEEEPDSEEEADDIVLVDGIHPRVVEDEKDLVILEDVEVFPAHTNTTPSELYQPQPQRVQNYQPQPETPSRKRSLSRNTLHRAVLIRSAQRAVLEAENAEREREEEEEEEMEVLEVVASELGIEDEEDVMSDEEDHAVEGDEDDSGTGDEEEEYEEELNEGESEKSTWRKSLERIWPFGSSGATEEQDEDEDEDENEGGGQGETGSSNENESEHEEHDENQDIPAPLPPPMQTPVRRNLGSFMTPQLHPRLKVPAGTTSGSLFSRQVQDLQAGPEEDTKEAPVGRYSLGGEARRVPRTEQVWRVRDIVVPLNEATPSSGNIGPSNAFTGPGTPGRTSGGGPGILASPVRAKQVISEEERKAIQERRRSALREVDTFFPGGVPGLGLSPRKVSGPSPSKPSSSASSSVAGASSHNTSPFKSSSPVKPVGEPKRSNDDEDSEEEIDTRSLLERMKETVEVMKQRRSMAPGTPIRLNAVPATPGRMGDPSTPAQIDFSRAPRSVSPNKGTVMQMMDVAEETEEDKENNNERPAFGHEEQGGVPEEVFSLLRPGVLEEVRAREEQKELEEPKVEDQPDDKVEVAVDRVVSPQPTSIVPVEVDVLTTVDDDEPTVVPKKNSRARLLRGKKTSPPPPEVDMDEDPIEVMDSKNKSKSGTKRARTPLTQTTVEETKEHELETEQPELLPVPPKPTARRGRKATVEPETEQKPEPVRRGRKPRAESEDVKEPPKDEKAAAPARRGRKPAAPVFVEEEALPAQTKRVSRKAAAVIDEPEVAEEPQPATERKARPTTKAPSSLPVRKTAAVKVKKDDESVTVKRGARSKPIEVDDDDDDRDPLDSIDADEAVALKPKPRRKAVKEETPEDGIVAPTTRSAKAKTAAAKTPAANSKSRAAKKVPVTAPPAVLQGVDKENTPGSEGSSVGDPDEPVKIRVSRTSRKAASGTTTRSAKVKQEDLDIVDEAAAEPEPPRGRTTRTTRARTRT